jgi:hypothetical protein
MVQEEEVLEATLHLDQVLQVAMVVLLLLVV